MTTIGSNADLKGELLAREKVEVSGRFQGNLKCRSQVIIHTEGQVIGEIDSPRVILKGKFTGPVKASRQLEILTGAQFRGELTVQPDVLVLSGKIRFE